MKRIVICMDGTWQTLRQENTTNIGIIARSVFHGERTAQGEIEQIVIYEHGVGSTTDALGKRDWGRQFGDWMNHFTGGIFGEGVEDSIVETYIRLAFNYEPGDEIYIFGFSRGAFAARSLGGMIATVGITSRRHVERSWEAFWLYRSKPPEDAPDDIERAYQEKLKTFRKETGKGLRDRDTYALTETEDIPPIRYMGIFETVVQRGLPEAFGLISSLANKRYSFHNLRICDNIYAARHALAIDENRLGFPPTPWTDVEDSNSKKGPLPNGQARYVQRWFVGMHGDVGGGIGSKLSALSLQWIVKGAEDVGLRFYDTAESPLKLALVDAGIAWEARVSRLTLADALSPMNYPVRTRCIWAEKANPTLDDARAYFDDAALQRALSLKPRYRPPPLRPFQRALKDWTPLPPPGG